MTKNGMRPIHPGEILLEEFMKLSVPAINASMLARSIGVPANRITAIIKGQRGISGDTAVRLATFFDTTAEFWMACSRLMICVLLSELCQRGSRSTLSKIERHWQGSNGMACAG